MSESLSDSGNHHVHKGAPVMSCQTAEGGGMTKQLVRGAAPSTLHRKHSKKRRMSDLLFFRCTPQEHTIIAHHAADAGLEQSSYLRVQALGKSKMRKCRRIRADWDKLRRCMGVINRAGNVVNQFVLMLRRLGGGNCDAANFAFADLSKAARAIVRLLRKR